MLTLLSLLCLVQAALQVTTSAVWGRDVRCAESHTSSAMAQMLHGIGI